VKSVQGGGMRSACSSPAGATSEPIFSPVKVVKTRKQQFIAVEIVACRSSRGEASSIDFGPWGTPFPSPSPSPSHLLIGLRLHLGLGSVIRFNCFDCVSSFRWLWPRADGHMYPCSTAHSSRLHLAALRKGAFCASQPAHGRSII